MRPRAVALLGALGALLGSCASGPAPAEGSGAAIVPAASLPERERAAWEAWKKGGASWELERERALADPALARFLVDNLIRVLVRSYDRSAIARAGEAPGPFERAQADLVALAPLSAPVLARLVAVEDGIVAFLAADTLAQIGAPAVEPALALLEEPAAEPRRRGAELLAGLPPAGDAEARVVDALARRAAEDEAWIVRAQSLRTLGARGAREAERGRHAALLSRALRDPDPTVVATALEALGALGEPRAVPAVIDALARAGAAGDPGAARAAQAALERLTGERGERDPAAWRRVWDRRGAELVRRRG